MFPLDSLLESCYRVREIGRGVAVHFISTLATRRWARHTLGLESMGALLDFLLKLLFG
jgi:hypothetical protein